MDKRFRRKEGESEIAYQMRICEMKCEEGFTWKEICEILNKELQLEYDESCYRKRWQSYQACSESKKEQNAEEEGLTEELQELKKERMKIREERNILSQCLKEQSRYELIKEEIANCIDNLKPIDVPEKIEAEENEKSGLLCISDFHYDSDFTIYGLRGEILNQYNPQIFMDRMWKVRDKVYQIVLENNFKHIDILELGDSIDGILRISALSHIKNGLTKSCIEVSNFMINWLNDISKFVKIKFTKIMGNHCDLRLLTGKKGDFPTENMSKIIVQMIKLGLQNNPNVEVVELYDESVAYLNIQGYDILATHEINGGNYNAIKEYENMYKQNIDIIIGGHSHYSNMQTVGIDKEVIGVPSIVGIDSYSMSLRKTANAGAKFLVIEKNYGISKIYDIKLK